MTDDGAEGATSVCAAAGAVLTQTPVASANKAISSAIFDGLKGTPSATARGAIRTARSTLGILISTDTIEGGIRAKLTLMLSRQRVPCQGAQPEGNSHS